MPCPRYIETSCKIFVDFGLFIFNKSFIKRDLLKYFFVRVLIFFDAASSSKYLPLSIIICPISPAYSCPLYNFLLIIMPPPIPVPKVKIIKFFFLHPKLTSARAIQPASFSISTLFLNFFSKNFFKLKFFKGKFGGFFMIPSFRGPAHAIPIPFTSLSIKTEIELVNSLMKSFFSFGVLFLMYFIILLFFTSPTLKRVPPMSIAITLFPAIFIL
ncbi:hypothetical protein ES703_71229 [subsurface metagenome]